MDKKRLEELKNLVQEKKVKEDNAKEDNAKRMEEMKTREAEFKTSFLRLETTVFKPYVKEANSTFSKVGVELIQDSNNISKELKNQIRTYFTIFYKSKGASVATTLPYIIFEGKPNTGEIVIAKMDQTAPVLIGAFKIEDLDNDKIEGIIHEFVMSLTKN